VTVSLIGVVGVLVATPGLAPFEPDPRLVPVDPPPLAHPDKASTTEMPAMPIALVPPNMEMLPGYEAALERGWSPDNTRDVSAEQLAALRADHAITFK